MGSISVDRAAFMLQCGIDSLEVGPEVAAQTLLDELAKPLPTYRWRDG